MGPLILGKEEILRNSILWVTGNKEILTAKRVLRKQARRSKGRGRSRQGAQYRTDSQDSGIMM